MPSAFRCKNQQTIIIDGIDEPITIQPLTAGGLSLDSSNRQGQHHVAADKRAVENGLVSVGDVVSKDWSKRLTPKAMSLIAKKILEITRP